MTRKNLLGLVLAFAWACTASSQSWVQVNAPSNLWTGVAYSANGQRIVGVTDGGGIYASTNWGVDWALTTAPATNSWSSVACSSDGTQIFATVLGGPIYFSRDAGLTWQISTAPTGYWSSVACSSDGTAVLGGQGNGSPDTDGFLYVSTNSGATWSSSDPLVDTGGKVAMSDDGGIMFAYTQGAIYRSTNSGTTWNWLDYLGDFAISENGGWFVALIGTNDYVSADSGSSGALFAMPSTIFGYIAAGGDGNNLVASEICGSIYTSDNGGTNWTLVPGSSGVWQQLAASPNGAWRIVMEAPGRTWISYVPESAPFFVQQPPPSTAAIQTTSVTFQTMSLGSDPMTLQWQCNGTNLDDDARITESTTATLTISNLQVSDTGTYILLATNRFGSVTSQPAVLTVNPDLEAPTLVVMDPSAGTNSGYGFEVDGYVKDDGRVVGVWFQLNSGPWYPTQIAEWTDSWEGWWSPLYPVPGTNVLSCYAMDAAGNCSPTNIVNFTAIIQSQLVLMQSGPGVVTPDYNGQFLNVGSNYTVQAKPAPRCLFAGWSGDIQSTDERLSFSMQSNLVLQANFVTNPFPPIAGRYSGIASASPVAIMTPSSFTAVVGRKGAFAARLRLGKQIFHCSGQFAPTGSAAASFVCKGADPLVGPLQLDFNGALRGELSAFGVIVEIGANRVVNQPEAIDPKTR